MIAAHFSFPRDITILLKIFYDSLSSIWKQNSGMIEKGPTI